MYIRINENCGTIKSKSKPPKWQLPVPKRCRFHQNDAKTKTMDKERLDVQNAANTVGIAASTWTEPWIQKKIPKQKKSLSNSRPFLLWSSWHSLSRRVMPVLPWLAGWAVRFAGTHECQCPSETPVFMYAMKNATDNRNHHCMMHVPNPHQHWLNMIEGCVLTRLLLRLSGP